MTTITASQIRKGDTVTLPSNRTRRIQRVSHLGNLVEIIFPDPCDGHVWMKADTLVGRA